MDNHTSYMIFLKIILSQNIGVYNSQQYNSLMLNMELMFILIILTVMQVLNQLSEKHFSQILEPQKNGQDMNLKLKKVLSTQSMAKDMM